MTPWNLEETREHVARLYGRDQCELVRPCLRSVVDRQAYARLHYQNARALFEDYVQAKLQEASLLHVTLAGGDEAWGEFDTFIRKIGAHLVACIQSMHALPDILAHAVYYSLAINRSQTPLPAREIGLTSVARKLQREADAAELKDLLVEIRQGGASAHLSALANHCKHRSIVFPTLNEDWTGKRAERHSVVLTAFEYEGDHYPQVVAREFLEAEYNRCAVLVVKAGNALNAALRGRAP